MRILYITTILCLGAHGCPYLQASDPFPDEEDTQGKNLPSQRQGETPPPQRLNETSTMGQWRQYLAQNDPEPLSFETLSMGQNLFSSTGHLCDWITLLGKTIIQPRARGASVYFEHLIRLTDGFAPPDKPLGMKALEPFFKDTDAIPRAARHYLKLVTLVLTTQPAAHQISDGIIIAKYVLISGFVTLCTHYMERISKEKGHFSREEAFDITQLILDAYASPYSTDLAVGDGWDRRLLHTVLKKTPAFSPEEQLYLEGFLRLASIETRPEGISHREANEIIEAFTPYLTCERTEKPHAAWAFPLLATAYHSLNKSQECVQVWEAYERLHDKRFKWSYRELLSALCHITLHANDIQTIDRWWQRYRKESNLSLEDFLPTRVDLNVTASVSRAYVRFNHYKENEILTRTALNYINGADTLCTDTTLKSHYSVQHFFLSLSLARSLTEMGRHEEAAAIYDDFFEWDNSKLFLKGRHGLPEEQIRRLKEDLKDDIKCAAVALSQAGRFHANAHADSQKRLHKAIMDKSTKRLGKRRGASLPEPNSPIEDLSITDGAKAHLIQHYTNRLQEMDARLEEMSSLAQHLELPRKFLNSLTVHKDNTRALQEKLSLLSLLATKRKCRPSKDTIPSDDTEPLTIGEIGTRVDAWRATLLSLEKELQNAHERHRRQRQRELDAYLARMSANDDELKHFTPEPAQESHSPKPKQKKKTRPNGREKGRPQAPPVSAPSFDKQEQTPPKATLFMKKKADTDYNSLSPTMHRKFHTLAREVAKNPYQILGGLGRPERLVSKNGIYFSRHLSDGDRVVYELLKGEDGAVNVVFLSLLGHYENLARHQESTHIHPLVLQPRPEGKSS
ncbi:MAG: type II toxin-antitoxin system YoeB family toxin [Proteobacteria bacterium]|nr:type II toxin-antitoxin system YoeB family toxin [Pseudomonadota bacterium]